VLLQPSRKHFSGRKKGKSLPSLKSSLTHIIIKRDNEPHQKPGAADTLRPSKTKSFAAPGTFLFLQKRGYYNLNGSLLGLVYFE